MKLKFHSFECTPTHVVGRCPQSVWPGKNPSSTWRIFSRTINQLQREYPLRTHAFVMMSNHYHWLCTYDELDHDGGLFDWFHELLSFHFLHHACRAQLNVDPPLNFFDGPPRVTRLDHITAFQNTYFYIYKNPVMAGLATFAEDYKYSTLRYICGRGRLGFLCQDPMNILTHPQPIFAALRGSSSRKCDA